MFGISELIDYENGELSLEGTLELFSKLIKSGAAWTLQGSYGRAAQRFIDDNIITADGDINHELASELCDESLYVEE